MDNSSGYKISFPFHILSESNCKIAINLLNGSENARLINAFTEQKIHIPDL